MVCLADLTCNNLCLFSLMGFGQLQLEVPVLPPLQPNRADVHPPFYLKGDSISDGDDACNSNVGASVCKAQCPSGELRMPLKLARMS